MGAIDLLDRPIAFNRAYVNLGIGITGALMLSQCIYWHSRTVDPNGWFYKSQGDWERETGMSRREQETARRRLVQAGFLEESRKGVPARLFFRVDTEALEAALVALQSSMADSANQVCTPPNPSMAKSANQECTNGAASMAESANQECANPPDRHGGKRQSITEITTETTPEITANGTSGPDRPDPTAAPPAGPNQPRHPEAAIENGRHWGTQDDLDLAVWMYDSLCEQLGPDSPKSPNYSKWANAVRLMREQDGRDHRHIRALYAWCRQHSFWAANIQSPDKLREKWPQLAMQRNRERDGGGISKASKVEETNREVGMSWAASRRSTSNQGRVYEHE